MYKGGYILNGVYVAQEADTGKLRTSDNSTYKASDHDRQRKDFAREIIQPHNPDGTPNEDFINAYPTESQEYGFVPTIEQIKENQ